MQGSRRDFLKLGAATALTTVGAQVVSQSLTAAQAAEDQGGSVMINVPSDQKLRLVSYTLNGERDAHVGVARTGGQLIDLAKAAQAAGETLKFDPQSMVSLIEAGPAALAQVRRIVTKAGEASELKLADVRLLPPIPKISRNIYAVGWNYLAHFEEGKELRDPNQELPEHPVFFSKAVHVLNGPYDPIPYDPNVSTLIDWECELAVIIGRRGRNIPEADALNYVFGYSVINDTTARDLQQKKHGGQWFKGKSLDGHGPLGPWIVPADELDPGNLHLLLRVNGVVKQDASTQQMYFKVPRIIAELSSGLTLEPGDIIATGTPPGIGHARKPPEYLKPGDVMESEIVEIGMIRNVIQAVSAG